MKVRKAIFPVAGLGTRFLPATKASPKEMLPVVDKPLIQYAVEEALAAGIKEMVFVTGRSKRSIEDHFDMAYELENELERRGKHEMLEYVRTLMPSDMKCVFIRQPEALGLGHAVLCAQPVVGNEPFAVLLADDLLDGEPAVMRQMVDVYEYYKCSVLGVQQVPREDTRSYGIVASTPLKADLDSVQAIVEKPKPEEAPSTLAVVGRYVLTPRIFHHLSMIGKGAGGEIQLTDGIAALMQEEQVLAYRYHGKRYDCGSKIGYLEATLAMARKHKEVGNEFERLLLAEASRIQPDKAQASMLEITA